MLFTEAAIFVHFKTVRVIFLVFERIVVALLAVIAREGNLCSHYGTSYGLDLRFKI